MEALQTLSAIALIGAAVVMILIVEPFVEFVFVALATLLERWVKHE